MDPRTFIVALTAVGASALVLLIAVGGVTIRRTVEPFLQAWRQRQDLEDKDATIRMLERRLALLEEQVHGMEGKVAELVEARSFERQLGSGE